MNYLIIGADTAIGEAVTNLLIETGNEAIGTYQKKENTKFHEDSKNFVLDHTDIESVKLFINNFTEPVSGIIICYLHFQMEKLSSFEEENWEKSIFTNYTMPHMVISGLYKNISDGGSVVFVTSTEGFIGSFGAISYASTKAAMHNLTMSYANNLGRRKIRVNSVAPGWIGGVMDTDQVFEMSKKITPLERLGTACEVADVIEFLLSEKSSFVNGTTIKVDGGYSCVDTISKYEFEAETN